MEMLARTAVKPAKGQVTLIYAPVSWRQEKEVLSHVTWAQSAGEPQTRIDKWNKKEWWDCWRYALDTVFFPVRVGVNARLYLSGMLSSSVKVEQIY